jgi:hypothetical protein
MDVVSVVVVATDENDELPGPLFRWLEEWQVLRDDCADRLVALFHPSSPANLPAPQSHRSLVKFVATSGVGFIWCGMPDEPVEPVEATQFATGS